MKSIQPVKKFSDEVLVLLSVWIEGQIVCIWSSWCHCHCKTPSSLASFKSRLVLPFWYRLIQVAFSALMLLVGRQEGHPACKKLEWWSAGVVICLERGADLHMAQLMPLPLTVSCFSKIQIGFTFLVPAHLGSPRKMAVKRVVLFRLSWKRPLNGYCSCSSSSNSSRYTEYTNMPLHWSYSQMCTTT